MTSAASCIRYSSRCFDGSPFVVIIFDMLLPPGEPHRACNHSGERCWNESMMIAISRCLSFGTFQGGNGLVVIRGDDLFNGLSTHVKKELSHINRLAVNEVDNS